MLYFLNKVQNEQEQVVLGLDEVQVYRLNFKTARRPPFKHNLHCAKICMIFGIYFR